MAQVYCEAYGIPPRSAMWRRMHEAAHDLWRAIERRTGGEDPADAEGVALVAGHLRVRRLHRAGGDSVSGTAFSIADAYGDGRCTVDEMMAAQRRSGLSEEEVRRSFDVLDFDGDGYISAEDFVEAHRDFYFSDDPNALGNLMAGDL
jgi:EF-hand domain pair